MAHGRFVEVAGAAVISLPQDLKAALRIVEDADMDDASRLSMAGGVLHVLSDANAIPGMRGILATVGDVIVLRLVLERLLKAQPDAMKPHVEDAPELFGDLEEFLKVTRAYLGDAVSVLEKAADGVSKLTYQGHSAQACTRDTEGSTWLYDAVSEAIVERFEFDEEDVAREVKQADKIGPALRSRLA